MTSDFYQIGLKIAELEYYNELLKNEVNAARQDREKAEIRLAAVEKLLYSQKQK